MLKIQMHEIINKSNDGDSKILIFIKTHWYDVSEITIRLFF